MNTQSLIDDPTRASRYLAGQLSDAECAAYEARFAEDPDALRHLQPGDGGGAMLDTVDYAVDLLQSQPKEYRRVLLLISEQRDHGSKHVKPERLVERIGLSDVLVLSLTFSPGKAEFLHDLKDNGDNRVMSPIGTLMMAVQGLKKNVAKQIALMSGGEYAPFTRDKGFQDGNPQVRQDEIIVHLFSDDGSVEMIFLQKNYQNPNGVSQPEINRIVQSLHKAMQVGAAASQMAKR